MSTFNFIIYDMLALSNAAIFILLIVYTIYTSTVIFKVSFTLVMGRALGSGRAWPGLNVKAREPEKGLSE